jgi:hypothetical protein
MTSNALPIINLTLPRLMLTERQFLSQTGLPGRPYYKHVVQAPGNALSNHKLKY